MAIFVLLAFFMQLLGSECIIHKNHWPQNAAALRVCGDKQHALDMTENQVEALYEFLQMCGKEEQGKEVTVIAVGDFAEAEMKQLIEKHLPGLDCRQGDLNLSADHTTIAENYAESAAFYRLPLDEKEKKLIHQIIYTMGNKNVIQLGFQKRSLEKKGKEIHHVHPLRFLGYVFTVPELAHAMREIKKSSFKWNGFLDGFCKKMKQESHRGNLLPYVNGFAHHLGKDPVIITTYIQRHDWEGLVRFLL